jgi:uncharacterized protein (DUF2141 family)
MKFSARVLLVSLLAAGTAQAATLTVVIDNIRSEVGRMNIAVYDNKKDWLGDNTTTAQTLIVKEVMVDGVITTSFELEPGEYAVSVHHDDNDNGKMDTNFIGIPKEPAGFSNDYVPMGPPRYKKAAFTLGEDGAEVRVALTD